jgi:hypothetical protein
MLQFLEGKCWLQEEKGVAKNSLFLVKSVTNAKFFHAGLFVMKDVFSISQIRKAV